MTADDLVGLLQTRHSDAVFIAECNMSSAHAACRRLDAWVLLKTWSPWTTIGYEVKVSRSDFLNDRKWTYYLPVCHEFYFVCPFKLIAPEELPQGVGLLWATGTGRRLVTKRKAVRREPDHMALAVLMSYALMSRARIVGGMREANGEGEVAYWRALLLEQRGERILGHVASRRIRQEVDDMRRRTREAEDRASAFGAIERRMREAGVDPGDPEAFAKAQALLGASEASQQLARARRDLAYHGRMLLRAAGVEG